MNEMKDTAALMQQNRHYL